MRVSTNGRPIPRVAKTLNPRTLTLSPSAFVMRRECPRITAIAGSSGTKPSSTPCIFSGAAFATIQTLARTLGTIENFAPMPTITAKVRAIAIVTPWLASRVGRKRLMWGRHNSQRCFSPAPLPGCCRWPVRGTVRSPRSERWKRSWEL